MDALDSQARRFWYAHQTGGSDLLTNAKLHADVAFAMAVVTSALRRKPRTHCPSTWRTLHEVPLILHGDGFLAAPERDGGKPAEADGEPAFAAR